MIVMTITLPSYADTGRHTGSTTLSTTLLGRPQTGGGDKELKQKHTKHKNTQNTKTILCQGPLEQVDRIKNQRNLNDSQV